jgi:hypothetical protein
MLRYVVTFLFSYSNPVCLHAARMLCLPLQLHMFEKAAKYDRYVWAMYHHVFDIFWVAWQSRIIIRPELEIYVTHAAGTWEQEPDPVLTSLTLNSTCELNNCRKIKWLVFCHSQVIVNFLQPPELELYQHIGWQKSNTPYCLEDSLNINRWLVFYSWK